MSDLLHLINKIKTRLKFFFRKTQRLCVDFGLIKKNRTPIMYISEKKHWAIYWEGVGIANELNKRLSKPVIEVTHKVHSIRSPIIHFGSQYMWEIWRDIIPKNSKVVVNFFHGKPEDGSKALKHIEDFISNHLLIDFIVVSNSITQSRLISWGIPEDKIVKIYIGLNSKIFNVRTETEKLISRNDLGFSPDEFVVGSFQKDGIGWGTGSKPKLIKGPDIFIKTVQELAKNIKVSVLLTGPSRGYLVSALKKADIKFKHYEVGNYLDIPFYYHALDLYLITSREEGGPKGLIEALASGVPVVSTPVGMCVDLLPGLENCGLTKSFEVNELVSTILKLREKKYNLSSELTVDKIINQIDYEVVANEYLEKVYKPLYKDLFK
jgi:glycosyltransferase involved in cell wall biosynthesis